jgi:hypothetical protein
MAENGIPGECASPRGASHANRPRTSGPLGRFRAQSSAAQPDLGRGDSILRLKIGTLCHGGFPLTLLTHFAITTIMNRKHRKTLKAIFAEQANGNIE